MPEGSLGSSGSKYVRKNLSTLVRVTPEIGFILGFFSKQMRQTFFLLSAWLLLCLDMIPGICPSPKAGLPTKDHKEEQMKDIKRG